MRRYHAPQLVIQEDPIEPPARLPFSDTLSTELLDVVRQHLVNHKDTRDERSPLVQIRLHTTTLDTTVLEVPLQIMFQE